MTRGSGPDEGWVSPFREPGARRRVQREPEKGQAEWKHTAHTAPQRERATGDTHVRNSKVYLGPRGLGWRPCLLAAKQGCCVRLRRIGYVAGGAGVAAGYCHLRYHVLRNGGGTVDCGTVAVTCNEHGFSMGVGRVVREGVLHDEYGLMGARWRRCTKNGTVDCGTVHEDTVPRQCEFHSSAVHECVGVACEVAALVEHVKLGLCGQVVPRDEGHFYFHCGRGVSFMPFIFTFYTQDGLQYRVQNVR